MRLLSLDLARKCGWASGDTAEKPKSWSSVLGEPGEVGLQCGELGRQLVAYRRDHGIPDLVCAEHWMAPGAQPATSIVESSLRLNGALHGVLGVYGCKIVEPYPATVRAAVCGRANAGSRDETKAMVIRTAIMLGLVPAGTTDDNRCDAAIQWHWAASVYGGKWPGEFKLVGA